MGTPEEMSQAESESRPREGPQAALLPDDIEAPTRLEPDLDFIESISEQAGPSFKKCFQCGTCSGTCELSPATDPFPRKEMAWAAWGLKDRLLGDPDIWLCYQCNDCSSRCPRGGRPGDVLAAVRSECVIHYAVPSFLAKWVSRPKYMPLLLAIPAVLLSLALELRVPIEQALSITKNTTSDRIVYSYSSVFPHWMLNSFFFGFAFLSLIAVSIGVGRFWGAMKRQAGDPKPVKGVVGSILSAFRTIFTHRDFDRCGTAAIRYWSHLAVFFGFIGLCLVTIWVITARYNPMVQGSFVYPFNFWNPWKILANLGGLAILVGGLLMVRDRFRKGEEIGSSTYRDWSLIWTLIFVAFTGLITEVMHYIRLEPHRHIAYFVHLVFVFALLVYTPYSKLAHILYRTVAIVFGERYGRYREDRPEVSHE